MTALRQRMVEDMRLRNFSPHTQDAYVRAVANFARHFKQSPQELAAEHVRQYLLHLVQERRVSWSLYNQTRCALQFFYRITLGRDERFDGLPCAREPKRIPNVLSPEELQRMFVVATNLKEKALLMTLYGAGLRASELTSLRATDIDSQRMLIHVRQGNLPATAIMLGPNRRMQIRNVVSRPPLSILRWGRTPMVDAGEGSIQSR